MNGSIVTKTRRINPKKVAIITSIFLLVAILIAAVYFFLQYRAIKADPGRVAEQKTQRLVEKVNAIYTPPEEEPTVAEINDISKLKEQQFFKAAQNGDQLFIYPESKIALIYRESEDKLINVGPIEISQQPQEGVE